MKPLYSNMRQISEVGPIRSGLLHKGLFVRGGRFCSPLAGPREQREGALATESKDTHVVSSFPGSLEIGIPLPQLPPWRTQHPTTPSAFSPSASGRRLASTQLRLLAGMRSRSRALLLPPSQNHTGRSPSARRPRPRSLPRVPARWVASALQAYNYSSLCHDTQTSKKVGTTSPPPLHVNAAAGPAPVPVTVAAAPAPVPAPPVRSDAEKKAQDLNAKVCLLAGVLYQGGADTDAGLWHGGVSGRLPHLLCMQQALHSAAPLTRLWPLHVRAIFAGSASRSTPHYVIPVIDARAVFPSRYWMTMKITTLEWVHRPSRVFGICLMAAS